MGKDIYVPGMCDDLASCLSADMECVPTLEYRLANLELPFDLEDINLFTQTPINLFVADPAVQLNSTKYAASNAVAQRSLQIVGNFLLMGICVWAVGEGMSMSMEGNMAGPQAEMDDDFASPWVLRNNDPGYAQQLGIPDGAEIIPAEYNFGAPVMRVVEDFLAGYNLKLYCPNDSNVQLIDEPVAEIGNCCAQTDWNGFSTTTHGVASLERRVNDRLASIRDQNRPDPDAYDKYFRVCNAAQGPAAGLNPFEGGDLVPTRYAGPQAAFGRVRGNPSIAYWYKLPSPLTLLDGTLLRVEFDTDAGHRAYVEHLIQTATARLLTAWAGMNNSSYPTNEEGLAGTADGRKIYLPGGRLRIGIGFKGFKVAENVCHDLATRQAAMGLESGKVIKALCGSKIKCGC